VWLVRNRTEEYGIFGEKVGVGVEFAGLDRRAECKHFLSFART
jgi:hypothetical protein